MRTLLRFFACLVLSVLSSVGLNLFVIWLNGKMQSDKLLMTFFYIGLKLAPPGFKGQMQAIPINMGLLAVVFFIALWWLLKKKGPLKDRRT